MAALANICNKMMEKGSQGFSTLTARTSGLTSNLTNNFGSSLPTSFVANLSSAPALVRRGAAPLRGFANEDIYFYVKEIDNSSVVKAVDPRARGNAWRVIGTVSAAALLGIGILLPGAYGLIAGYDIQRLQAEAKTLEAQKSVLDLRAAKMMTPARMEALAAEQGLTDPAPQNIIYLDGTKDDTSFAANHEPALPESPASKQ